VRRKRLTCARCSHETARLEAPPNNQLLGPLVQFCPCFRGGAFALRHVHRPSGKRRGGFTDGQESRACLGDGKPISRGPVPAFHARSKLSWSIPIHFRAKPPTAEIVPATARRRPIRSSVSESESQRVGQGRLESAWARKALPVFATGSNFSWKTHGQREGHVNPDNAREREQAKQTGNPNIDQQGNRANVRQNASRQGNRRGPKSTNARPNVVLSH
jgi:hypothetical protein